MDGNLSFSEVEIAHEGLLSHVETGSRPVRAGWRASAMWPWPGCEDNPPWRDRQRFHPEPAQTRASGLPPPSARLRASSPGASRADARFQLYHICIWTVNSFVLLIA